MVAFNRNTNGIANRFIDKMLWEGNLLWILRCPKKQGLYNPWFEHDACGVGVVANIKGKKSNKILRQALVGLHNMDHRDG